MPPIYRFSAAYSYVWCVLIRCVYVVCTLCVRCVCCVYVVCVCVCVCRWRMRGRAQSLWCCLTETRRTSSFSGELMTFRSCWMTARSGRSHCMQHMHTCTYPCMERVSVNSFSIICHLPQTHEFLGPTLRNTVGATGSNFRFQNMTNNNYYRGFNCIYSIYTCTCNYKICGHIFPSSGERIHHSWVSPRGPHQATRGGVGEEAGPFCRDSGKTNA